MNNIVQTFGNKKIWVNWRPVLVKKPGEPDKITKPPYNPKNKRQGSSTDPNTWTTYAEALLADPERVGIIFDGEKRLLGVDLDHCLDGNNLVGGHEQTIAEFLIEADTYTEKSPSGSGLHCVFMLEEPLDLIANRSDNFECYTSARFFTFTGDVYQEYDKMRTITKKEALELLVMLGYPWKKTETIKPAVYNEQTMEDAEIVDMMFKASNGIAIKKLYEGDKTGYNNDDSAADMALCAHLAFWTGKVPEQMERIWLESPLGHREKTRKRRDYRVRTINNAIKNCKEVYGVVTTIDERGIDFDFLIAKKKITLCAENILRLMRKDPVFIKKFRYDNFRDILEIEANGKWFPFEDKHIIKIQSLVAATYPEFQTVTKATIYDCIIDIAHENAIDSAVDYLRAQEWDGVARLDTWLCSTYGVEADEYHIAVGANWLKGLVKRLVYPGCKFDYVLVVEGPQGTMKSTSLNVLGRDWHMETTASTESKDFFMSFLGKAIIEFSEGETLSRTEVKRLKAIITTQVDKFRAPYDRVSRDHPRRCVFAMTTNSSEYLKDETGNRRWLPIEMVLPKANIKWLEENRDQLFAEAYKRVIIDKETIYEFPEEETIRQQNNRRISDPNTELIADWYENVLSDSEKEKGITVLQVWVGAFKKNFDAGMTKANEMSIANVLREELKLNKVKAMIKGRRQVIWFPPDIKTPLDTARLSVFQTNIDYENINKEENDNE